MTGTKVQESALSKYACKACGGPAVTYLKRVRVVHRGDCERLLYIAQRFPVLYAMNKKH